MGGCPRHLYNVNLPTCLNMASYTSVYAYSGSTHSGHYTAYIRDVDNLGNWMHPVCMLIVFIDSD